MLSLRLFARSVPRSIPRFAALPARQSCLHPFRVSALPCQRQALSRFSTSARRFEEEDVNNDELIAKLDSEIRVETDLRAPSEEPPAQIQEYLESSQWQLHDDAGSQEVRLTRSFGSEEIEVSFSVADISNIDENQMNDPDTAYGDEYMEESAQSGGANTKGAVNQGRTSGGNIKVAPEDRIAPADRPELDDEEGVFDDEEPSGANFPIRLLIKVTRKGQAGALEIEAVADDGDIMVENVFFYASADMADPKTSEGDYKRRLVYGGPRYDNLDPDLQSLMDQFLAERGINAELSNWLPDFVDWKEQKEYVRWLTNVKDFLS